MLEVDQQTNLPSGLYRRCASFKKIVSENNNFEKYNHFYISPISYLPLEAHFQNTLNNGVIYFTGHLESIRNRVTRIGRMKVLA